MPDLTNEIEAIVSNTLRESTITLVRGIRAAFNATRKTAPEERDELFLKFLADLEASHAPE